MLPHLDRDAGLLETTALLSTPSLSPSGQPAHSKTQDSLPEFPAQPLTHTAVMSMEQHYQQEILELKKKQLAWMKANLLYYFKPQDQQVAFFECQAPVKMAEGSNRSGKTTAGIVDDICHLLGFYPWKVPKALQNKSIEFYSRNRHLLPKDCLTPRQRPLKFIVLEDDWETADEILISGKEGEPGKLIKYVPPACFASQEKNGQGYVSKIIFTNGSSLAIDTQKAFTNDPGSFEGKDYDRAHFDEPKCREMWVSIARGLVDRKGDQVWTLTPLKQPWLYDQFRVPYQNGEKWISVFFFDTELNPYINREGWEAYKASLTEDEAEARVKGKWTHLQGLVYKEFLARLYAQGGNLIEPLTTEYLLDHCSAYSFFDVHQRQNQACLLVAKDDRNRTIVFDEVFVKALFREFGEKVRSKVMFHSRKTSKGEETLAIERWLCDPLAFVDDPVDGHKWADEFIELGFPVEPASKLRDAGIAKTRQAFKDRTLLICTNCHRLIWELQHYVYAEWRNSQAKGEKEKPVDKDDHMVECLYRAVMADLSYVKGQAHYGKPIEGYKWA